MALFFVLLLAASSVSAETLTLSSGGRERWALVREPAAGKAPRPVVLLLHGGGSDPAEAEASYGMSALAEKEKFLVVYPAGTSLFFDRRLLSWNAGNCCGYGMKKGVDDVAFLAALIDALVKSGRADPRRVYVTGFSNGAMLAHRFACERADLVAAIAPVAGAVGIESCRPSRPVPVMVVHGRADEHVPFDGGAGERLLAPRMDRSVAETVKIWKDAGSTVTTLFHPGGHVWPGGVPDHHPNTDRMIDEPKATPLIWAFFQKHPRR